MKNWPKRKGILRSEIRILASRLLVSIAQNVPETLSRDFTRFPVRMLRSRGPEHARRYRDSVALPDGINVRPICFSYYRTFFTEDVTDVRNGLRKLQRNLTPEQVSMANGVDRFENWFDSLNSQIAGGSDFRIAPFKLAGTKYSSGQIRDLSVTVHQITPSVFCLNVNVWPSDDFLDRFSSIIQDDVHPRIVILRFGFLSGGWSMTQETPWLLRQNELENLYLGLNKELTQLLALFLGAEWGRQGPFSCVHVFSANKWDAKDRRATDAFWRSLDLDWWPPDPYIRSSEALFVNLQSDATRLYKPHRLLVSEEVFDGEEAFGREHGNEYAMGHKISGTLELVVPVLAIHDLRMRFAREIGRRREKLHGRIIGRTAFTRDPFLYRAFKEVLQHNSLSFKYDRIVKEMSSDEFLEFAKKRTSGFEREKFGEN